MGGRREGGGFRRIQLVSEGFRRIQKTHITATAYGLLTKFLTLDYPMGGNSVEAFEGNLRFLEEAAIVTSSW